MSRIPKYLRIKKGDFVHFYDDAYQYTFSQGNQPVEVKKVNRLLRRISISYYEGGNLLVHVPMRAVYLVRQQPETNRRHAWRLD